MTATGRAAPGTVNDALHFLGEFGRAAHTYGATGERIEGSLAQISRSLGYVGVFKSGPADLILLDWSLPGMALAQLIAQLQAIKPRTTVVVLGSQPEAARAALAAGADRFVSKADPPDRLMKAVRETREAMRA